MPDNNSDGPNDINIEYLRLALDQARKCIPVPTAFCVGCVIVVYPHEINRRSETYEAVQDESPERSQTTMDEREERKGVVLSTGYSRELPGNTHAEANALSVAYSLAPASSTATVPLTPAGLPQPLTRPLIDSLLHTATVYTTLEPCSTRTSGLAPCANALAEAKVKEVVIGVGEPDDFVNCEGARVLKDAGVLVTWAKGLEEECLRVARGDFS